MLPKRFEGRFGIPGSHGVDSQLTSALYRLPESVPPERIELLTKEIAEKIPMLSEKERQTLELKLARHFEDNGESAPLNIPTVVDALIESPRFLQSDKGSMTKLFELHEMKTLQKIAEIRRRRAEITAAPTEQNPYENLFETTDGQYYLSRLLNMPHLEEESEYMDHCVGTSDSYVNKMKRGEVEIFSFRDTKTHKPVVTIEYDTSSHKLLQVKAASDRLPTLSDPFAKDLIEVIEKLPGTVNDAGKERVVESKEVLHLRRLLTLQEKTATQEAFTRDDLVFLYELNEPIQGFDEGREPLIAELLSHRETNADLPILFDCSPEQIAHTAGEIRTDTKAYIGKLAPDIFDALPSTLEHVYTKFPEERLKFRKVELGTGITSGLEFTRALTAQGIKVEYAKQLLNNPDFTVTGEHQSADLVEVSVAALGFNRSTRYDQICARAKELGLELCPAEVGPQLRLQYQEQPLGEYLVVAMKAINDLDGDPRVFAVSRDGAGLWVSASVGRPDDVWGLGGRFVFLRPRK